MEAGIALAWCAENSPWTSELSKQGNKAEADICPPVTEGLVDLAASRGVAMVYILSKMVRMQRIPSRGRKLDSIVGIELLGWENKKTWL